MVEIENQMTTLEENIAAWNDQIEGLRLHDVGRWTVFHDKKFQGAFDEFHDACVFAMTEFGEHANYLLRELWPEPARISCIIIKA